MQQNSQSPTENYNYLAVKIENIVRKAYSLYTDGLRKRKNDRNSNTDLNATVQKKKHNYKNTKMT